MIYGLKSCSMSFACFKVVEGDYEISIAVNDSNGALVNLSRSDIRVYQISTGDDLTEKAFSNVESSVVDGTFRNLEIAIGWVRQQIWEAYNGHGR